MALSYQPFYRFGFYFTFLSELWPCLVSYICFTTIELGKTMALLGAISIILSNLLGFLILKEVLPIRVL